MKMYYSLLISISIGLIIILVTKFFSSILEQKKEKWSTFECGFTNESCQNNIFSSQFFMTMIMFLIFDIEISLLFPTIWKNKLFLSYLILFFFLLILVISLLYEWNFKKLNWTL